MAVADRLHSAAVHLLRRLRLQDVAAGLGPARLSALSVVVFAGPLTLKELAEAEQVRPPTMSKVVAALARAGLVRVRQHPADGRAVEICATGKGARVLQSGRRRRVAYLARHLRELEAREVVLLGRAAELIERALRRRPTH